jgi:hypothetical protein
MTDSLQLKTQPIRVVLVVWIEGMFFNPHRAEGIELNVGENEDLRFQLGPMHPDKDASGRRCGLECKVYATLQATDDQAAFIGAYNQKRMLQVADNVELPLVDQSGRILIGEDGSFPKDYHPTRNECPVDIVQFIEKIEADLTAHADRFLKLIRWRQGIDAAGDIIKHASLYWTVEKSGDYPGAPLTGATYRLSAPSLMGIQWDEQYKSEIFDLWNMPETVEPLGHALLREAASVSNESPRSSILIMTAALETAVKMHISKLAQDTAWLMEETSSPPIFKILRDYIPLLHTRRGKDMSYWSQLRPLILRIQKLIEVRNKVAHTGRIPAGADTIYNNLQLVCDFLYILDVLDGMEWAKTRVSAKVGDLLNWPKARNGRHFISITQGH